MNNTIRNIVCCLTAVILLVTTSGCDWLFPLTSPSRATVDKRLLGYWKVTDLTPDIGVGGKPPDGGIMTFNECAKLSKTFLDAQPDIPRGAMFADGVRLNDNAYKTDLKILWPTKIGSTSYLNWTDYSVLTKNFEVYDNPYVIYKYVVAGDTITLFALSLEAITQMKSSLGKNYTSADQFQEIFKATDWEPFLKLDRIRL
jgi:hypothetical protein